MALAAAVLLYLALALPHLNLPGLHYDEAKEAGVNAMEMLLGQDVHAFRSAGVQIGPIFLPLMVQDYIGALNVYLALPFLAYFGVTVPALRLVGVTCGLATLLLVWRLGREVSGVGCHVVPKRSGVEVSGVTGHGSSGCEAPRSVSGVGGGQGWTGEIAALLLAASPTFVFWSRQGIFVTNVVVTLAVATVLVGLRWWHTRRPATLYLLAVLAGLGLWAKLLFVWVLGAMAGVALVMWVGERYRMVRHSSFGIPHSPPSPRHLLIALLLFLAALSPLILFNQQTGGTLQSVFGNLDQSYYGVNNADFVRNVSVRLAQLSPLLNGSHLWYLGEPFANAAAPWIAATTVVLALVVAGLRRERAVIARLLLALLFVALLVVQSSFTVSDLFITHDAIIQPFVILLVALAVDSLWRMAGGRKAWRVAARRGGWPQGVAGGGWARVAAVVAAVGLVIWIGADLRTNVQYHQALARSGGQAAHSDASYRLAQWLDKRHVKQPLALDWGIDAPIRYLTENRVEPLEIFGYDRIDAPDPGFDRRALQFLADPTRYYILRMPADTVFQGRREALERLAGAQGLTLFIDEAFYDGSGKAMFVILHAEPGLVN